MKKKVFILCMVFWVIVFSCYQFSLQLEREVRIFVSTSGKTRMSSSLHTLIKNWMYVNDETFVTISRDMHNQITSLQLHTKKIGLFSEELALILHDAISSYNDDSFGVPLGNLSGLAFLSNKGPIIPVEPVVLGNIASDLKSDFISAGINQTLYRVTLTYSIAVRYLSPLQDVFDSFTLSIVLVETLIVGDVPIYRD